MTDQAHIEAITDAVRTLNDALFAAGTDGLAVKLDTIDHQTVGQRHPVTILTARVQRIRTEIDVKI